MRKHRPDPRRCRRILGWTAAGVLAIQFAGSLALDYVWPEIRFPLMGVMQQRLAAEPRSPDVVILGSSRFQTSLDATELTHELRAGTGEKELRVFQAAVGGSDCITMELALNNILAAGHRPRLVVVEMTPPSIARNTPWYVMHVGRLVRWDNLLSHFREIVLSGQLGRLFLDRTMPLYRHRYETLKALRAATGVFPPAKPPILSAADLPRRPFSDVELQDALVPRALTPEETERGARGIKDVRREISGFAPTSNALDALDRMLARCRQENIAVILVGAPVTTPFREAVQPVAETYHACLKEMRSRHGVEFFDGHAVLPDHLFADYHHTTPVGGLVFSRLLARRLLVPLLSGRGE